MFPLKSRWTFIEHDGGGDAWLGRIRPKQKGGSMDWLHLLWDIASAWVSWHWLFEKRQVETFDVHEFELGLAALFRDVIDPFRYRLAVSTRARASENDCDLYHVISHVRVFFLPLRCLVCCRSLHIVSSLAKAAQLS